MENCVTVAVGARLHLGFLDLNGGLGRRFGSLGLALDGPETVLELSRAPTNQRERAAGGAGAAASSSGWRGISACRAVTAS